MAERGIPYTLITPYGSVVFNDLDAFMNKQPSFLLTAVNGLDGGAVRATVERIPQRDGAVIFDAFQGEMNPILEGKIWASTAAEARERSDYLKACCKSILRADGTLTWFPSGSPDRKISVRLFDRVTINPPAQGTWSRTFQISLVSPDDRAYSLVEHNQDSSVLSGGTTGGTFTIPFSFPITLGDDVSGGVATVTNSGGTETFPVVRLYGPVTAPRILNVTTNKYISLPGLIVGTTDYVEIDMRQETIRLNGNDELSLIQYLDVVNSEFWSLVPGDNSIRLIGTGGDGFNTKAIIYWRDAWA